jgi:glucokinase
VNTPAIEIGGSHVSAALVDPSGELGPIARAAIDGHADAATLLGAITSVASRIGADPGASWGVAIPGPFDYDDGIGRYEGVGKFEKLNGIDVGEALRAGVDPAPGTVRFVGDAVAFAIGEWTAGQAGGRARVAALTLGTGVGSAFLVGGRPVTTGPTVPPEGRADLLAKDGTPLEDLVSTRAVLAAYRHEDGPPVSGVADIARLAADGNALAARVFADTYRTLGEMLKPFIQAFSPEILVVGGGISAAWQLIEPPLREGLGISGLPIVRASDTETSALRGAAVWALQSLSR